MGVKPRLAFGPLRVAVTGRQVSPPLFESMEILGRDSLARLRALRASWPDRCARPGLVPVGWTRPGPFAGGTPVWGVEGG